MSYDPADGPAATPGSNFPLQTRLTAARAMLEEGTTGEYQYLSSHQQARIQEAIEYLREAEAGFRGGVDE